MADKGQQWERKVGSIFDNIGFAKVDQPDRLKDMPTSSYCYGRINPDVQNDIIVRVDRCKWVLIECQNRRNTTIRRWVRDVHARTDELLATLNSQSRIKNTEVLGVAATSIARLSPKFHKTAEKLKVSLWHHGFVDYLIAISKGAGAQVRDMVFYRCGLRHQTYPEIKISVLRWPDCPKWFIGFVSPAELARVAFVPHRGPGSDLTAYQRLLKPGRIEEIANFVKSGSVFPNAIIVSLPSGFKVGGDGKRIEVVTLKIPGDPEGIRIIDGQHRFFGALASGKDVRLLTTFINADELAQAIMFAKVNGEQISVKEAEVLTLYDIPRFAAQLAVNATEEEREKVLLKETIYLTMKRLNTHSVLKDRLSFYSREEGIPFKHLFNTILNIANNDHGGYHSLRNQNTEEKAKEFGNILSHFLDGWLTVIGEVDFYDDSRWFQSTMLSALFLTFPDFKEAAYPDVAASLLRRRKSAWREFKPNPKSYRGSAGAKALAKRLCRRLNIEPRFV